MVQARRSLEDPKTWIKLQDTEFQDPAFSHPGPDIGHLGVTESQDPAFGHPGPGVGHLGADIQGTGIDPALVIPELIF